MKLSKTITFATALIAGMSLFAAPKAQAATELHVILCGELREADQKVVDAFTAKHSDVTVNLEIVPWGTCQDKSRNLAAAGDPPSVAYMGSRTLRQLVNGDLIVPADITDEALKTYQPGVLETVTIKGTQWAYPHAFSTKALFINCDLAKQAGIACEAPKTWDEMYAMAKAIHDNTDAAGVGIAGKDFDNTMHQFLNYLYSNGGVVIDTKTGENKLNSDNTRETLAFYEKLVTVAQEGPTAWERSQLRDLYNDSKIGMYVEGPWGRSQHNDDIDEIAVPIPAGPSGSSGTLLITDSIVVFKGSGHEELAQELATALTSGEAQYTLDSESGLTPIFDYAKLGMSDLYYENDPYWAVFIDGISRGGPEPLVEDFKALQSVFTNMIQGIILADDTLDNLVDIAGEELDEAL